MNKEERFERGTRLIEDARFVKEVFLPAAFKVGKWNIVAFEAYRAAELLLKGITYLTGYEPSQHHRLHVLAARLSKILERNGSLSPFVFRAVDDRGNSYQIWFHEGAVTLLKHINGLYTQLGSSQRQTNPYYPLRIHRKGNNVTIYQGRTVLFSNPDASLPDSLSYEKKLLCSPDKKRVANMMRILEVLLNTREEAFYSERQYSKADAELSKSHIDQVFEHSKAFEVSERL